MTLASELSSTPIRESINDRWKQDSLGKIFQIYHVTFFDYLKLKSLIID